MKNVARNLIVIAATAWAGVVVGAALGSGGFSMCLTGIILLYLVILEGGVILWFVITIRTMTRELKESINRIGDHAHRVHRMVNDAIGEPPPGTVENGNKIKGGHGDHGEQ
jgi:uncharacterized protein YneF (UPF0154 family)